MDRLCRFIMRNELISLSTAMWLKWTICSSTHPPALNGDRHWRGVGGDCKSIIAAFVSTTVVIISSVSQLRALCDGTIRWCLPSSIGCGGAEDEELKSFLWMMAKNFPLHRTQFVIKSFIITHEWVQLILTSFFFEATTTTLSPALAIPIASCDHHHTVAAFSPGIGSGHNFAVPFAIFHPLPSTAIAYNWVVVQFRV